jgi:hypothetical protein
MAQFAAAGSVLSMALANYALDRMIASPSSRVLTRKFAKIETSSACRCGGADESEHWR